MQWISALLLIKFFACIYANENYTSYKDLLANSSFFAQNNVTTFSQILFNPENKQVFVGARDKLYRLSLNSLAILDETEWKSSEYDVVLCEAKGISAENCHNYIKVLLKNETHIFVCGTNAFKPSCTWRDINNITTVVKKVTGIGICPHSLNANVTAYLNTAKSDEVIAATSTDFAGLEHGIYKFMLKNTVRPPPADFKWIADAQFVGKFEDDGYLYFIFRETAMEHINCGKRIYSRIARVCKNDIGDNSVYSVWTTYSKTRLKCLIPGDIPFEYNEVQSAIYNPTEQTLYATFTTPVNAIAGSAVCSFNLSSIKSSFNGDYLYQKSPESLWKQVKVTALSRLKCTNSSARRPRYYTSANQYNLMSNVVNSITLQPLYKNDLERYTHIAVDTIVMKNRPNITVLYVATNTGIIKQISFMPFINKVCLLDKWGPLPSSPITMEFLKDNHSLYIGMKTGLLRVPAGRCHRYNTQTKCINSQNPYCGWNTRTSKCAEASSNNIPTDVWLQNITDCPKSFTKSKKV